MRAGDATPPAIPLDAVPTLAAWPIRPVVGIATTAGVWRDATCAFFGLDLTVGALDERFDAPSTELVVQLDNRDGSWSRHNPDGTPTDYRAGCAIVVLTRTRPAGVQDWLFSGVIASIVQHADDTVTVTAFDAFADLAQTVGTYTAGVTGDSVAQRGAAILAAAGRADLPRSFHVGAVTVTAQATDQAPLDQLAVVASSDGGVVFVDVDGTIRSYGRHWRNGRPDQLEISTVSDNVCGGAAGVEFIVWAAVIGDTDGGGLADRVVVENVAELRSTAGNPTGRYVWSETDLQYETQAHGDLLAADLLADQQTPRLAVESFDVYLFDPTQQPAVLAAAGWRRFDRLHVVHDEIVAGGGTARVAVEVVVAGLRHSITAGGQWIVSIAATRATGVRVPLNYWDTTTYTWDDPAAPNVWS